ncbi:HWE histidine kinase domain-containing protein [Phenylobacterium sp.]|uniref:sensor histidine kinase n=1 Tax=Phenylobacterium sp. TaxID=1871053 RepID=UPI002810E37B|nr:HWE histidine kinase domain-containing protein [Phenylobacterium sp.]
MTQIGAAGSERALILAPLGRDAQVAEAILREAGLDGFICHDLPCLVAELDRGAGVALIVEESLLEQDYIGLAHWIDHQPSWSDFPIVVLSRRGGGLERNPAAGRISQALGNVTFLERPFHPTTLVSVIRTALRGRRRQYEARERIDAIRTAEEHFRTLAENIPILCWMARPDGHVFWYNPRWYEYTGASPDAQEGWGWASVHDPQVLPTVEARWRHSLATGETFEMTFPLRGADGVFRPFLTRVTPLRDEAGRIVRWFGTNTDVSRQLQDQERLRLMVNELNHRVKNTLATVQSIIALSLRGVDVPGPVRETLTNRILALSKAHDVLTDEQWSGADLREIVQQAADPYQTEGDVRFRVDGPPVRLPPRTAIAIALALHELATNAAKYGALSAVGGRVDLIWDVVSEDGATKLRLDWRESGGPPVEPPKRTGFGTRLIERGLSADLQGRVTIEYLPAGVVCAIEARLPPDHGAPSLEDFLIPLTRSARATSPA